MHHIKTGYF